MPKNERALELDEAEKLLDVVFGVVIALALTDLPRKAWTFLKIRDLETFSTTVLLSASLIFAAFYWIESRYFLRAQQRFGEVVKKPSRGRVDGVRHSQALFLLGTLAMMAVASGVLGAAVSGAFRPFLIANVLFWLLDFGGVAVLRKEYRLYEDVIREHTAEARAEYEWFKGHIISKFFYIYSAANATFFVLALAGDYAADSSDGYRAAMAVTVLAVTLLRHLVCRSWLLDQWIRNRLSDV